MRPNSGNQQLNPGVHDAELRAGVPNVRFQLPLGSSARTNYDVTENGERFLVSGQGEELEVSTTITLNWPALLTR